MNISGIDANNSIVLLNLQASKTENLVKTNYCEVSDNFSKSDDSAKFKEIVKKYDITNISQNEMNKMYKELYDSDLISLKDMMKVTLDYSKLKKSHGDAIKQATGIEIGNTISISGWPISTNSNQKMNFLEGLKTQAEWNKNYGNPEFQDNYEKRLELAEKIKYFQ